MMKRIFVVVLACFVAGAVWADSPVVSNVHVKKVGMVWRVDVTLHHPDSGWDHYADGWEVLDKDGNRLAYRELLHPHVTEQPFTRGLSGVVFPDGTREIFVRASCSVDGWTGKPKRVELKP